MIRKNMKLVIVSSPFIIILIVVLFITRYQYKVYWDSTIARVQTVDFNILHATLPYAIAFLEENNKSELIQQVLNSNFGLFSMCYTDIENNIKFSTKTKMPYIKINQSNLNQSQFSYVYKKPHSQQCVAQSPYDVSAFICGPKIEKQTDAYGKIYLLRREKPSIIDTIVSRFNLENLGLKDKPIDDYVLNLLLSMICIAVILGSGITLVIFINKKDELLRINHEKDRKILTLEIDKKEKELDETNELLEILSNSESKSKEELQKSKEEIEDAERKRKNREEEAESKRKDLEEEIITLKNRRELEDIDSKQKNRTTYSKEIGEIIYCLLPDIRFTSGSINNLAQKMRDNKPALILLQKIAYRSGELRAERFEGTEWLELGHVNKDWRIYYKKQDNNIRKVHISPKTNQGKDSKYLKTI